MKKRKEQKYHTKELEAELIDFLQKKHKKSIALEVYMEKTKTVYSWTYERKVALFKTAHESSLLVLGYVRSNQQLSTCVHFS